MPFSSGWCGPLQSSEFPNWLGAVGTSAAALVAALGFVLLVLDRRKAQARAVSVTMREVKIRRAGHVAKGGKRYFIGGGQGNRQFEVDLDDPSLSEDQRKAFERPFAVPTLELRLQVSNLGTEEVTHVVVAVIDSDGDREAQLSSTVAVAPGSTEDVYRYVLDWADVGNIYTQKLRLRTRFTDPAGKRWERITGSRLRPIERWWQHSSKTLA